MICLVTKANCQEFGNPFVVVDGLRVNIPLLSLGKMGVINMEDLRKSKLPSIKKAREQFGKDITFSPVIISTKKWWILNSKLSNNQDSVKNILKQISPTALKSMGYLDRQHFLKEYNIETCCGGIEISFD